MHLNQELPPVRYWAARAQWPKSLFEGQTESREQIHRVVAHPERAQALSQQVLPEPPGQLLELMLQGQLLAPDQRLKPQIRAMLL